MAGMVQLKLRKSVQSCGESCTKTNVTSTVVWSKPNHIKYLQIYIAMNPSPGVSSNKKCWTSIDFSTPIFRHAFQQFTVSLQKIQWGGSLHFLSISVLFSSVHASRLIIQRSCCSMASARPWRCFVGFTEKS